VYIDNIYICKRKTKAFLKAEIYGQVAYSKDS
jgi:hypothetical protein